MSSAKLLIAEPPLQVLPTLAKVIGLNEAIVLQQLHYYSRRSRDDGWVQQSFAEWRKEDFCFWGIATVKRVFASLRDGNLVETERVPTKTGHQLRVRVNHDALEALVSGGGGKDQIDTTPSDQSDPTPKDQIDPRHSLKGETETSEDEIGKPISSPPTKKNSSSDVVDRPEIAALCHRLAGLILQRDPKAKVQPDSDGWLTACRRLLDLDKRSVAEVERVIDWCQADEFWQANVLSMPKLREKFDALWAKASKSTGPRLAWSPTDGCPTGGAPADLAERWESAVTALRGVVDQDRFEMWLGSLHPHGMDGGRMVLGCSTGTAQWVSDRFADVLATAVGCPVRVVACDRQAG